MKGSRGKVGKKGEDEALEYLLGRGHTILARNWRKHRCEIDIISLDSRGLHFVEVKTRTSGRISPLENITPSKKRNMVCAAMDFLSSEHREQLSSVELFFDIVTVVFEGSTFELEYIPEAFIPIFD